MNYRMQCSCGHALYRGADSREAAIERFKAALTQQALDMHYAKYHPGEAKPPLSQMHTALDSMVTPAVEALSLSLPPLVATS